MSAGRRVRSRRSSPAEAEPIPAQLATFDPAGWPGLDATTALQCWHAARISWHDAHRLPPPRDHRSPLGTTIDVFRGLRQARRGHFHGVRGGQ
jgi:hypothetical protein